MSKRKPRGISGSTRLTGGSPTGEFIPLQLPNDKASIERVMCDGAYGALQLAGREVWPTGKVPRQLAEDNFDFAFDTAPELAYLDLAEVAPLSEHGGRYENAPRTFKRKKLVNAVKSVVQKKAMHYGLNRKVTVHLLLYVTDYRFRVSDTVVVLLRIALARTHYAFKSVCFYAPVTIETGVLHILWPSPDGVPFLSTQQERELLEGTLTNFDPRYWKHDDVRGGFFPDPPDAAR